MLPEGKLVKNELLIRDMNLPEDVKLAKKSLVRWLALSLGLISPNESRTIVLDVLEAMVNFQMKNMQPSTKEILEVLAAKKVQADEKSIYYHLLRMKDSGIIGRKNGKYFFGEGEDAPLSSIIRVVYQRKFDKSFSNIELALKVLESYGR